MVIFAFARFCFLTYLAVEIDNIPQKNLTHPAFADLGNN
jgi:hypothetical protein